MIEYKDFVANLVVAGVTKTGTSSLYWYLIQHPEICPPKGPKEIDFFTPMRWGKPPAGTLEDYGKYFATCDETTYRLDASPQYFDGGSHLVNAVRTYAPHARVIVSLRDPVQRVWSNYRTLRETDKLAEDISFREFFERGVQVHAGGRDTYVNATNYRATSLGYYVDFLNDWFDEFGDDVLVIFFEHLMSDPRALVSRVFSWLGVDPAPAEHLDYTPRNRTIDPRSMRISKMAYALNRRVGHSLSRVPIVKDALRSTYFALNRTRTSEPLSDEDRAVAEQFYRPANLSLRSELARRGYTDLPDWLSFVDAAS